MTRNQQSQRDAATEPRPAGGHPHQTANRHWEQMVLELRAFCNDPPEVFGEMATARYLFREDTEEDRKEVAQTIDRSADLPGCVILAKEVLTDTESTT